MSKRTIILFVLLSCLFALNVYGGEFRKIQLNDGSVINGEIVSFEDGTYTVETENMGTLSIDGSDVSSILSPGSAKNNNFNMQGLSGAMSSIQDQLLNDDAIVDILASLKNDPQMAAILNDPAILEAIKSGNITALMGNQKILDLMSNPKIMEINSRMGMGNR